MSNTAVGAWSVIHVIRQATAVYFRTLLLESCRTKRVDNLSPVLRSLHWPPVCQRIDFKITLLAYEAPNGLQPDYISDLLLHYEPSAPLKWDKSACCQNMDRQHFYLPLLL